MALRKILTEPLYQEIELDAPAQLEQRRKIILQKMVLKNIYKEWYFRLTQMLPAGDGAVLELGSGAGFLDQTIKPVITSDIIYSTHVNAVLDATALPFPNNSVKAILMVDVLHHIPNLRAFFHEASRVIQPGGIITMIEPWVTTWSRLVYTHFHHEPFLPNSQDWSFPSTGPMSGANSALPWMLFKRDRATFEDEFPQWEIQKIELLMPFRYLLTGGVSIRKLSPDNLFGVWRKLETLLNPLMPHLAMFANIRLEKKI